MTPQAPGARHFGLDWLRIGAFLLLIFFHIGKFFAPDPWLVNAPRPVAAVDWLLLALQPWRMSLLFVVSGYASYALLARSGSLGSFLRSRSQRLLLPLGLGILLIVPPQTWIGLTEYHGYREGLLHFWTRDWLAFGAIDGVAVPNSEHLWFVAYLWTYTMALGLALILAPPAWRARGRRLAARLIASPHLFVLPLGALLLARIVLLFTIPETHGLFHDWVNDLTYVPAFLFGFGLAAAPALWPVLLRARIPAALTAAAAFLLLVAIALRYPGERPHLPQAIDRDASLIMAWSMIVLLLGAAHRWLNRDHPLRARLCEAVFPFYLVHQTIIVVVGWRLKETGLGNAAMFGLLVLATFAGCWAFYAAGSRIPWLRPFIGLAPAPARDRPAGKAAALGRA